MRLRRRVIFADLSRPRIGEMDERRVRSDLYTEGERRVTVAQRIGLGLIGLSCSHKDSVSQPEVRKHVGHKSPDDTAVSRGTTQREVDLNE